MLAGIEPIWSTSVAVTPLRVFTVLWAQAMLMLFHYAKPSLWEAWAYSAASLLGVVLAVALLAFPDVLPLLLAFAVVQLADAAFTVWWNAHIENSWTFTAAIHLALLLAARPHRRDAGRAPAPR